MSDQLKLEIDGKSVEVPHGSTVMEACNKLGIYVPHFCYHKKLSIAANCRMCLVEIEKAPKAQPACATPVTDNMKVHTHSPLAKKAQNSVMEFLLINHPLDCPICDQGGECQLQDLAVGYGKAGSRYQEEKRVVLSKNVGPLVAAEEMSRCIQCTRCVRFGQEVAGMMELGMVGRGEHSEIVSFVGKSVDSELSGNMIDLCPVGALTSKPFRYSARTWELSRRRSVSPHDGLGSNLIVQTRQNRVMRVLPLENEAINECWLSDKDRFSYEGLNSPDRLTRPMVRRDGEWVEVDWEEALDEVVRGLKAAGSQTGILASPHATLEELHLVGKLAQGLGASADYRLRQSDFSGDAQLEGVPWLGMPIADLAKLDRVLIVGSFLRKDHPLIAQRLRQAAKRGLKVNMLDCAGDDPLMPVAERRIVAPSRLLTALAAIAGDAADSIHASLKSGRNTAVLLGNLAQQHPHYAQLHAQAQALAQATGAKLGFLGEAANSVGGRVAGLPVGDTVGGMLASPRKAYVLVNVEAPLDCADGAGAVEALGKAGFVVALTPFRHSLDVAHVLLPVTPFTEAAGSFVNTEGRLQSFNGAVRPLGEARPGWKVLRVLGTLLGFDGFSQDSAEQVRDACIGGRDLGAMLSNRIKTPLAAIAPTQAGGIERIADVPIHFADALVRRAPSLQKTRDAQVPRAWMNAKQLQALGLAAGQPVVVRSGGPHAGEARLVSALDDALPDGCVRVAAAHPSTVALGPMFGQLILDKLLLGQAA